jgi:hypothetical protein
METVVQVAVTTEATNLDVADLSRCSAAIQSQVANDFGPIWNVNATVDAFAQLDQVPLGYWPVIVLEDIHDDGALGFHVDKKGQPFALVKLVEGWETTVSHETLEMLADPYGNRVFQAPSLKDRHRRVQYLCEVCDPSEAPDYGYTVHGLLVSDFYTPRFFDRVPQHNVRYSFTGAIERPLEVKPGGYLTWFDPVDGHAWQQQYFGSQPEFVDLGAYEPTRSLREFVDRQTQRPERVEGYAADAAPLTAARDTRGGIEESASARAQELRDYIKTL